MSDQGAFAGRVALVTGASGDIGAAICRALGRESATVAVGYGSRAEPAEALVAELGAAGVRAQAFGADLAQASEAVRLVAEVEAALGPVDVLVANHGVGRQLPYEEVDAAIFDETLAVNLRAPFLLARRVLPGMRSRGFGRVLFMGSLAGLRGGVVGPHYAASKAGLHGMTHFLAARAAPDGVTVNTIAPGFIDTAMLPDDASRLAQGIPVGRVGRPEEVADLTVATLRNGYLTSKVIAIDGGMYPR